MPLRKPKPLTTSRINALQDRVIDVVRDGHRNAIPLLCAPTRFREGRDINTLSPAPGAGWTHNAAGYISSSGGGGTDEDYAAIGFDVEAGDIIVGYRALLWKTQDIATNMRLFLYVGGGHDAATIFDTPGPAGEWFWREVTLGAPITAGTDSYALGIEAIPGAPGQRFGLGFVLVRRPP